MPRIHTYLSSQNIFGKLNLRFLYSANSFYFYLVVGFNLQFNKLTGFVKTCLQYSKTHYKIKRILVLGDPFAVICALINLIEHFIIVII